VNCDFICGCDGATSECRRKSIPSSLIESIEKVYPFCWLSILVEAPPSGTELVYSNHSRYGLAIHSFRSPSEVRFHLQVSSEDTLDDWPDERIWKELNLRLLPTNESEWKINQGPITQRTIFPIRSIVYSPMQYKRLFLVGDSAHIVPPTGAKGLNVAVNDAKILAEAFCHFYDQNCFEKLNSYTDTCLNYVWQAQLFANNMTLLLHNLNIEDQNHFDYKLQQTQRKMLQQSYALQLYFAQMISH
jgi:p-hydroxybenzoate 3-monooxygenase